MAGGLKLFRKKRDCTIYVAKTKVQLICAFVFTYAKSRFSHELALTLLVLIRIAWLKRSFKSDYL